MEFAIRLRNSGIDAILDQWELQPGDDLTHFMETNLASAKRVLMICTEKYVEKANSGLGGVGYEKMIVTSDLLRSIDSNKVIPIIRQTGTKHVPTFLKTKLFIDFSSDGEAEFSFDELIRTLVNAPLFKKPAIGNSPFTPISDTPAENTADAVLELMKIIVKDFESHSRDYTVYETLLHESSVSRLLVDITIKKAKDLGLISQSPTRSVSLTEKGKHYALQHKLAK
jgi:hypothetical protein